MPAGRVMVRQADAEQAAACLGEFRALYSEVYADPPYEWGDEHASLFAERFTSQVRQEGFALVEARDGHDLAGMAFGLPVTPVSGSSGWWQNLTAPLAPEITAEWPGRTFALIELLVRVPWRRQHVARDMHDLLLHARHEERAILTALPAAAPAQEAYRTWGWRKVAQRHNPLPGLPLFDVLIKEIAHPGAD
jgi:hypothetical protein